MKTTSMSKGSTPGNYVRELRLRRPVSSQVYLSILNGFQRFVAEQAKEKSVSQARMMMTSRNSSGKLSMHFRRTLTFAAETSASS